MIRTSHIVRGGAYCRFKCFLIKLNTVLRNITRTTNIMRIKPTLNVLLAPCSTVHIGNFSQIAHIGSAQETIIPASLKSQNNALRLRSVIIYHPFCLFKLVYCFCVTCIQFFLLRVGNISEDEQFRYFV